MHFEYVQSPSWPKLAWLARCRRSAARITVQHGGGVETDDVAFCEAVWAGGYNRKAFDESDLVFGSGGRLRDGSCTFVSSGSTVDRLHVAHTNDEVLVSNSLVCILEAAQCRLDSSYPRYCEDFYSVCSGLSGYKRRVAMSVGDAELSYFDNLHWSGLELRRRPKPCGDRIFNDYESYLSFLRTSLRKIAENMSSSDRRFPYRMLGTLSTGYDSSTVSALAREVGLSEVLCFDRSHSGEADSGKAIAKYLGLDVLEIRDGAWRDLPHPEIPFLASNAMGEEVRFKAAESHLSNRVLMTGYHGDKIWDLHTKNLSSDIVRGDPSGLSLTEYRLWAGFIHCPLPFFAVRQIRQVHAISASSSLKPWDVGGSYSRPICRRIVEGAGVPRELFGMQKRRASVMLHNYEDFLTASSRADFIGWLRKNRFDWIRRGSVPPFAVDAIDKALYRTTRSFAEWSKDKRVLWRIGQRFEAKPIAMRRYLFPWAIDRARQRYRSAGEASDANRKDTVLMG